MWESNNNHRTLVNDTNNSESGEPECRPLTTAPVTQPTQGLRLG
ncbi:hypothetical protein [Haloquadratum walsbyi]|nr:hypothetical protein [Haloquadratum walsbyi]